MKMSQAAGLRQQLKNQQQGAPKQQILLVSLPQKMHTHYKKIASDFIQKIFVEILLIIFYQVPFLD